MFLSAPARFCVRARTAITLAYGESTELLATEARFHNSIHGYDTRQYITANLVTTILAEEFTGSL